MRFKKLLFIVISLLIITAIFYYLNYFTWNPKITVPFESGQPTNTDFIDLSSFNPFYLQKGLELDFIPDSNPRIIKTAVIPHHLLPFFIHADFFKRLQLQKPTNVILIGPNHPNMGDYSVITTTSNFKSMYGQSNTDPGLVKSLITEIKWAGEDTQVLSKEHSVTELIPYFHFYLPNTTITPFILKPGITEENLDKFYEQISINIKENTVVVFSIDFSHYLDSYQAREHDSQTLKALQNNDYSTVLSMGNNNVDSPESLGLFLNFTKGAFNDSCEIMQNTNSGEIVKEPFKSTTSYFYILCY
ncbi:AmmeMemoRadiSam system protein B [bacterium]|nr:AmmeMemoRadiSam system protein B [bacterium]